MATQSDAHDIYKELQSLPGPLFHPPSPIHAEGLKPHLQPIIASLMLHPYLECALHLLNHSLYPAHYITRKMQNATIGQWEHGILHRIEGDYDNARAWYKDASGSGKKLNEYSKVEGEEVFVQFWSARAGLISENSDAKAEDQADVALLASLSFIDRAERMKQQSKGQVHEAGSGTKERRELEEISKAELMTIVEWAGQTFGWGRYGCGEGDAKDASGAYTGNTEEQKKGITEGILSGGTRDF